METVADFIFLGSKITAAMKWRLLLERKSVANLDGALKKQRYYFAYKGLSSQSSGFPSSHVWIWELDLWSEGWALKNFMLSSCGAGEDSWESLGVQGDQTSPFEGNQSWIFIGRTSNEVPILWPPAANSQFMGKKPQRLERLKERGEEDGRGWEKEIASLTQRTWIWTNSGRQWWTGKPDMLFFLKNIILEVMVEKNLIWSSEISSVLISFPFVIFK